MTRLDEKVCLSPKYSRFYEITAAQFNFGLMYDNGQGVTKNYVSALMWINLAASIESGEDQKWYAAARDKSGRQNVSSANCRGAEVGPRLEADHKKVKLNASQKQGAGMRSAELLQSKTYC